MCETHSVIPPIRFIVKSKFRIAPVKFTRIDYDSSDSGSMPADPFGEGMHHDVRPVFNRAQERRRGESGIDDQRQMVFSATAAYRSMSAASSAGLPTVSM